MSQLVIRRTKALWQDRVRDYIIFINGNEVNRIGNDAETIIQVEPGAHTVRLKIDWCHSPEVKILVSSGETAHLECGPNANPFLAFFTLHSGKKNISGCVKHMVQPSNKMHQCAQDHRNDTN